jgi:hypothetical protein
MTENTTVEEVRRAAMRLAEALFDTSEEIPVGTMFNPTDVRTSFTLEKGLLLIMSDGKAYRLSNVL